jgi:hypothetical protein
LYENKSYASCIKLYENPADFFARHLVPALIQRQIAVAACGIAAQADLEDGDDRLLLEDIEQRLRQRSNLVGDRHPLTMV